MKLLNFLITLNFVFILSACSVITYQEPEEADSAGGSLINTYQQQKDFQPDINLIADQESTTALELTEQNATVEYEKYDFGVFVTSINGRMADDENFWSLYVNDVLAEKSADQTILQRGDKITWRYEEVQEKAE